MPCHTDTPRQLTVAELVRTSSDSSSSPRCDSLGSVRARQLCSVSAGVPNQQAAHSWDGKRGKEVEHVTLSRDLHRHLQRAQQTNTCHRVSSFPVPRGRSIVGAHVHSLLPRHAPACQPWCAALAFGAPSSCAAQPSAFPAFWPATSP